VSDPVVREVLDFTQPVALMLVAILHFIPDEDKPAEIIATLLDALPPGSYLVASHGTHEHDPAGFAAGQDACKASGVTARARDSADFARLAFSGLQLVPPGVVLVSEWRPDTRDRARPRQRWASTAASPASRDTECASTCVSSVDGRGGRHLARHGENSENILA
jgi:hypothetical protein